MPHLTSKDRAASIDLGASMSMERAKLVRERIAAQIEEACADKLAENAESARLAHDEGRDEGVRLALAAVNERLDVLSKRDRPGDTMRREENHTLRDTLERLAPNSSTGEVEASTDCTAKDSREVAGASSVGHCFDCGLPYTSEKWCDVIIPDEAWREIANVPPFATRKPFEPSVDGGGLLCFNCIAGRLEHVGLVNVPVSIRSGPFVLYSARAANSSETPKSSESGEQLMEYTFSVWPDEQSPRWEPSAFELFRYVSRIGMEFTPRAFREYEESLARCGLTLREVERRAIGPWLTASAVTEEAKGG